MKHTKDFTPTLLSYENLQKMGISYSREHLRRLEAAGNFPRRLRLSPGRVAWVCQEVREWINEKSVARYLESTGNDS